MAYCTGTDARNAGAQGDDATLAPLIVEAQRRVEEYTGDLFEPTATTVVARISRDGTALLPHRPVAITDVRPVGGATPVAATGYRVLSSAIRGQVDAIILGGSGGSDPLILGAEPWNGGWRRFLFGDSAPTGQVQVTGMFGWALTPWAVRRATAVTVAALQTPAGALDADDEGNAVSITQASATARGTGSGDADALLAPYVRTTGVRIS